MGNNIKTFLLNTNLLKMYLNFKIFSRLRKTVLDNSNQTVSAANFKDLCDAMSRNKQN